MARILAVVSQKGGVGKTSLVQNLGAELANQSQRVLLVDFDPQSNLTTGWGLDPGQDRLTVYNTLLKPTMAAQAVIHLRSNLDLLPSSLDLAGAELQLVNAVDRNNKLKRAISTLEKGYDFVLIDCPPSLSFCTINALAAATEVIIPLQCESYAYKALDQLLPIIEEVRLVNPGLELGGVVLTMYDARNSLTTSVEELARDRFKNKVFDAVIPRNIQVAKAPAAGEPVGEYDPKSRAALAYQVLAEEVLHRAN
jgi:chromosome partitioning protein